MRKSWIGMALVPLVAFVWFGLRAVTVAAPSPQAVAAVKHRQAVMKGHAADLKAVKAYLEGTGSQAMAEEKASALAQSLHGELPKLFLPGTSVDDVPGSHAKPDIWREPAKVAAAERLAAAKADALAAAVKTGDKQQIAAAFGEAGKACGGCHRDFKTRSN